MIIKQFTSLNYDHIWLKMMSDWLNIVDIFV